MMISTLEFYYMVLAVSVGVENACTHTRLPHMLQTWMVTRIRSLTTCGDGVILLTT
jgi:hypothetical protein